MKPLPSIIESPIVHKPKGRRGPRRQVRETMTRILEYLEAAQRRKGGKRVQGSGRHIAAALGITEKQFRAAKRRLLASGLRVDHTYAKRFGAIYDPLQTRDKCFRRLSPLAKNQRKRAFLTGAPNPRRSMQEAAPYIENQHLNGRTFILNQDPAEKMKTQSAKRRPSASGSQPRAAFLLGIRERGATEAFEVPRQKTSEGEPTCEVNIPELLSLLTTFHLETEHQPRRMHP